MNRSYSDQYHDLLFQIMNHGIEEKNERTGHVIRALPNMGITVDLSDQCVPVPGNRKVFPKSAAAEACWFLSGERDVTWMAKHAPIWNKFTEADGLTIKAAYGYRWRDHFGKDQIDYAIDRLILDNSDRRVVVMSWDPGLDLFDLPAKNVPCPLGFTLNVIDGKLNMMAPLRSSDVFVGLPYDVMTHSFLLAAFARKLQVNLGSVHFPLAHAHIYDSHFEMAEHSLRHKSQAVTCTAVPLWGASFDAGMLDRDGFVEWIKLMSADASWPDYNPLPEVIE